VLVKSSAAYRAQVRGDGANHLGGDGDAGGGGDGEHTPPSSSACHARRPADGNVVPVVPAMGLGNFGNTCYMNAVIQMLYCCEPLRNRLAALLVEIPLFKAQKIVVPLSKPLAAAHAGLTGTQLFQLAELFDAMASKALKATAKKNTASSSAAHAGQPLVYCASSIHMAPQAFVAKVKKENVVFRNTQQQDAHELAIFIISSVVEDERSFSDLVATQQPGAEGLAGVPAPADGGDGGRAPRAEPPPTPIQRMFQGQLLSKTYCVECDTVAERRDPFVDLCLEIAPLTSLRHAAQSFSAVEFMCGDDKYRCDACTSSVDARRRLVIRRAPDVLLVQLKRFKYVERLGGFAKMTDRVPFADTLLLPTDGADGDGDDDGDDDDGDDDGEDTPNGVVTPERSYGAAPRHVSRARRHITVSARRYALSSVVVHQGATAHLGHYFTVGRTTTTNAAVGSSGCGGAAGASPSAGGAAAPQASSPFWCRLDDELAAPCTARDLQRYFGVSEATGGGGEAYVSGAPATAYLLMYTATA
jgi:ubiquitin C-terminal hydrolase